MRITFLGTGAAGGVPLFGCDCAACRRATDNERYRREPCSALVDSGDTRILIDAGLMDLHRRFQPGELDAILLTHFHPDHVQGLLHLRWGRGAPIPVFTPPDEQGMADLYKHPGLLDFRPQEAFTGFRLGDLTITPVPLNHSKPTFGYHFRDLDHTGFSYLTDTCGLPATTRDYLQGQQPDGLALDCTFPPKSEPRGHNDWQLALEIIRDITPNRAWLTHIRHDLDEWLIKERPDLPDNVQVAQDGDMTLLGQENQGQV